MLNILAKAAGAAVWGGVGCYVRGDTRVGGYRQGLGQVLAGICQGRCVNIISTEESAEIQMGLKSSKAPTWRLPDNRAPC